MPRRLAVSDVWILSRLYGDCHVWRDAVCPHGFTWYDEPTDDQGWSSVPEYVTTSVADALRQFRSWDDLTFTVVKERYHLSSGTLQVWVLPGRLTPIDNHDGDDEQPAAVGVIERFRLHGNSRGKLREPAA